MDIVIPLAVAVLSALGLLYPLIRPPLLALDNAGGPWSKLAALEERKLTIYGAIREASFDYRTDKIGEADYRREVEVLKREAVQVIVEIETLRGQAPRATKSLEKTISTARRRLLKAEGTELVAAIDNTGEEGVEAPAYTLATPSYCTSCGQATGLEDRFCAACGAGLRAT